MESRKCSGYYAICQNKYIKGLHFIFIEDKKTEHAYCLRCVAFGVKMKHFDRDDVLKNAPFLKKIIEIGDGLTEEAFMEKLKDMKSGLWDGVIADVKRKDK